MLTCHNFGRGRSNAIVVCEEHLWITVKSVPDSLVYTGSRLQEYPNILFKKPRAPAVVDGGQCRSRHNNQVRFVGRVLEVCRQGRKRTSVISEVDYDLFACPT